MSENPAAAVASASVWKRKVGGIPVLYLALGFVVILAVIAYRMKPTSAPADPAAKPAEASTDTILSESSDYPPLPLGTVSASSGASDPGSVSGVSNESITDNDEWLRRAVMFLSSQGISPGDAQYAMALYLDGADLSYEQGQWRDKAIRELGVPPFPVNVGQTRPDIGRVQGPVPRDHVVKNQSEDSADELASLYYGRNDAFAVNAIRDANSGVSNYSVGSSVHIPTLPVPTAPSAPAATSKPAVKTPAKTTAAKRTYTVKRGDSLSAIAKKYYGSFSKWPTIYNANRNQIKNPDLIYPGQVLVIP